MATMQRLVRAATLALQISVIAQVFATANHLVGRDVPVRCPRLL